MAIFRRNSGEYAENRPAHRLKWGGATVILLLLLMIAVGIYWSGEPKLFDVDQARARLTDQPVVGATSTATMITIVDVLLDKRGGYLSNDITPPSILLDNIPSWEFGALVQVRDFSRAMRESFSRSQSQSAEDEDLSFAEPRFAVDHTSWAMPFAETEYRDGQRYLKNYLNRLTDADDYDGQFFARADNLNAWLANVETRLGSLSQRLSASVGQERINTDLAGDPSAQQSTPQPREREIKTPRLEVDNVFYEARGSAWALLHLLKAVQRDFDSVLQKKNAQASLQQIIRELEMTQKPVHAPIILNGGGFGLWANHSLVMASYISRANAAIIDLRELLARG